MSKLIAKIIVLALALAAFAGAGWVSYGHGLTVAEMAGEAPKFAWVWPLLSDVVWPVATVALAIATITRFARTVARVAQVVCFGMTLFANSMAALTHAHGRGALVTVIAFVVAGWPAVSMLLTGELVTGIVLSLTRKTAPARKAAAPRKAPAKASQKAVSAPAASNVPTTHKAPRKRATASLAPVTA